MLKSDIKTLITILEKSNIDEIEVSTFWGKQKIRLRKKSQAISHNIDVDNEIIDEKPLKENETQPPSDQLTPNAAEPELQIIQAKNQENDIPAVSSITMKAPLVGTFYKSLKPDSPPFVAEGDEIKEGQVICIIEAMKIFNEIESEFSGKILKILIEDATPVEFDQDLFIISTD